jgi:beta-glucosidase
VHVCLALAAFTLAASVAVASVGAPAPARAADACPWMDATKSPEQRAQQLVSAMTIDQKIAMLAQAQPIWAHYGVAGYVPGQPDLCIPDLVLNDAGQGVGDMTIKTTAFPAPISQSASWDSALQTQFGKALGWEAWHKGINVQLAPGIEVDRLPINGRNFEYPSEDPYLAGQGGAAEVRGIQSNPVIATVKHYVANSQETNRMTSSSDVDERTMEEIYAVPYEAAVKQGHTGSVMCSYNRINGVYACENPTTLNKILKEQFGFDGFVMSDWGGTHSTVDAANAGLDMEMDLAPGKYFTAPLKDAVQAGQVPMSRLDDMVLRIVRPMFRVGLFEHPTPAQPDAYAADVRRPEDITLARRVSEDGTVLLKNADGVLPLTGQGQKIAVVGPGAGPQGAAQFYNGGGSAHIPETAGKDDVVSPQDGITRRAQSQGDTVLYADGSAPGGADAVAVASAADVAVVFVGAQDSEGNDRSKMGLSSGNCSLVGCSSSSVDQDALIEQVAAANPNTIVVLNTGGPVEMPWLDHIKGLVEAWYPGQEDGNAIAALLFGDVNPSAKLPETFPASQKDLPTRTPEQYPGVNDAGGVPRVSYSEGLLVGYRWYDAKDITPLFPFGFGLSYTTFALHGLKVQPAADRSFGAKVHVDVENTGERTGAEVAQLYVGSPASAGEPPKQLRAFDKVTVDPGETRTAEFRLDERAFSIWDVKTHAWKVVPGCYKLMAGRSSRDIDQEVTVAVGGASCKGAVARVPASCVDRRKFTFRLHHAPRARVVRVEAFVNGRRKLRRRGHNIKRITLAKLPSGRFVVKIVATQSTGSQLVSTRTYIGCRKGRPRTRGHHPGGK